MWLVREARKHILAGDFRTWKEMMVRNMNQRLYCLNGQTNKQLNDTLINLLGLITRMTVLFFATDSQIEMIFRNLLICIISLLPSGPGVAYSN
jgi:hypothetical protein